MRTVTVNVPVVQPVDPELTKDCVPTFQYGERTHGKDIIARLVAVEDALAQCRGQLGKIRQ